MTEKSDKSFIPFGERVLLVRKMLDWSQTELADYLGVSQNAVSKWEKIRLHKPSKTIYSKLLKLSELSVNMDYLKRGIAPPINDIVEPEERIRFTIEEQTPLVKDRETEYAYAGSSGDYQTARVVEESWNYVKREVQKNNPMKIFRVVGDSMTPTLYDTDMVFAIPEPSIDDIRQTYIYVVHSNRHKNLLIKRVVNRGDGTLLLSSDNKQHKNFIINIEDIGGLWRVRAYLSWQMGAPVLNADRLLLLEDRLSKLEGKL